MRRQPRVHDAHLVHLVGRDGGPDLAHRTPAERGPGALHEIGAGRERAPVGHAPGDDPEPVEPALGRVRGDHQTGSRMGRLEET